VISARDPYGRIIGFLDWSRCFSFQVAPQHIEIYPGQLQSDSCNFQFMSYKLRCVKVLCISCRILCVMRDDYALVAQHNLLLL
jgi:hypothetical protein